MGLLAAAHRGTSDVALSHRDFAKRYADGVGWQSPQTRLMDSGSDGAKAERPLQLVLVLATGGGVTTSTKRRDE